MKKWLNLRGSSKVIIPSEVLKKNTLKSKLIFTDVYMLHIFRVCSWVLCEKVANLRLLSARLCLDWGFCFLLWGIFAFPVSEVVGLDLDTVTWGFIGWFTLRLSVLTTKPGCLGDTGSAGDFPVREALMVTCSENTTLDQIYISLTFNIIAQILLWLPQTFVPGGRPSRALGFLKVLWTWVLCSTFSL